MSVTLSYLWIAIQQELAPVMLRIRLPGFIGPVPPPLWIRVQIHVILGVWGLHIYF